MIRYVVAHPFLNGLCYMVVSGSPFIPPAWVPDIDLATQFIHRQMAEMAAAIIPGAIIEEIEVEDED